MKTKRLKKIIVRTVLNVFFIIGLLYFFRNNSILRPIAKGAYYKEYLSALFLLSMIYFNYLILTPKFFQKRRYFLFLYWHWLEF